jgi:hypothetical protein
MSFLLIIFPLFFEAFNRIDKTMMDEWRSMSNRAVKNDLFVGLVVMQNTLAVVQRRKLLASLAD